MLKKYHTNNFSLGYLLFLGLHLILYFPFIAFWEKILARLIAEWSGIIWYSANFPYVQCEPHLFLYIWYMLDAIGIIVFLLLSLFQISKYKKITSITEFYLGATAGGLFCLLYPIIITVGVYGKLFAFPVCR